MNSTLAPCLEQHLQALRAQLEGLDLAQLGRQTGYMLRQPRKVPLVKQVLAFVALATESVLSLERAAAVMGLAADVSYSKQALHERLGAGWEGFLAGVATALLGQISSPAQNLGWFKPFGRVLLHDSTVETLPDHLAEVFPGSANGHKRYAALKVQFICDLLKHQVVRLSLSGFNRNDQAAAPDILQVVQPGDLVIRDLGYFVLDVFKQIDARQAFFLSRYRHDVLILDPATGQSLDLAERLRRGESFDQQVLLGTEKLPVRLVAQPVPEALANERRRQAKANRDRRLNPSARKLFLLGWNIFLTNVPPERWPARALAPVYRLRWRIEMIFKAWKSHLRFRELNVRTPNLLRLSVMTKLLFCITVCRLGDALELMGQAAHQVSLLRLARILGTCSSWFAATILGVSMARWLETHLHKHLFYEPRKDRQNFYQLLAHIQNPLT